MEATTNTFVALLQLKDIADKNRRLVVLKKFLNHPDHSDITIINSLIFPFGQKYCAMVLLNAPTLESIEDYSKDYLNVIDVEFYKVISFKKDTQHIDFNYTLFAGHDALQDSLKSLSKKEQGPVQQILEMEIEGHKTYKKVYLLKANSAREVIQFGTEQSSNCHLSVQRAADMQSFLDMKLETIPVEAFDKNSPCNDLQSPGKNTSTIVINDDDKESFYSNSYFDIRSAIPAHGKITSNASYTHINKSRLGIFYFKNTNYERILSARTNFPLPDISIRHIKDGEVSFNLSKNKQAIIHSKFSTWINELLHTDKYHKVWPEDHYKNEEADAYNYILSQIPGHKKPKDNTVKPGTVINIEMPSGDYSFTEDTFNTVKHHLVEVCTSFEYLNDWYSDHGHFDILIREIASVSTLDLISASNAMSIPKTDSLEFILDDIFAVISSAFGMIPKFGSLLSGVIRTAWTAAKNSGVFGDTSKPIQAIVSELADKLSKSMKGLLDSSSIIYKNIASDWGKLEEFASDAQKRVYLPKGAFGTESLLPENAKKYHSSGLPSAYIEAGERAWTIIFYQLLFTAKHKVDCSMDYTYGKPYCKLNPLAGTFYYTMPAKWYDVSNNVKTGHITLSCSTTAPKIVLDKLFGPDGLGVDPYAFFIGFNGWPAVVPHLFIDFALIEVGS